MTKGGTDSPEVKAEPGQESAEEEPETKAETEANKSADKSGEDAGPTFPDKLFELLQNEVEPTAIWWLPDGESFGINKELFEEKILNRYFRGNKFTSITRNLNRWYVV